MNCEICEHCQNPVSGQEAAAVRGGFSYHKKCHKCYVCSETDLHNAEVFKGVIFCSSCAQRIFQGCASARKTKQQVTSRGKHSRSRSRRHRGKSKPPSRRAEHTMNGVIELAQLAGSTSDSSRSNVTTSVVKSSKPPSTERPIQVCQEGLKELKKSPKKGSTEIGTTTYVTQELLTQQLLNEINPTEIIKRNKPRSPIIVSVKANRTPTTSPVSPPRRRKRRDNTPSPDKTICSDLRIAELGASTEIANMALRKKSEMPVIIKSENRLKQISSSLSVLNQESDISGDGNDWSDSAYSTLNRSVHATCLDRRFGSVLKLPYRFFKRNILARSSLISVLMTDEKENKLSLNKRIKMLFDQEIAEHQGRGIRRLYSTINRRKVPYKMGWLDLAAKVSKAMMNKTKRHSNVTKHRCKHFRTSHSYRCMRAQAMRLAGPTNSELLCVRNKIKKFIVPTCFRNLARRLCDVEDTQANQHVNDVPQPCVITHIKLPASFRKLGKTYTKFWSTLL
ncbi:uncharacterized protein LOC142984740 [Anticarsia gemmatalis]|uniref:uncharacterized protein LOC142984740 n=1 Tax=Anticarsia gemmatalis TaxID=129554 RepID=UPI003F76E346